MYPVPNEDELQIVNATTEQLSELPIVKNVAMQNSGFAYMIAKRVNHLQVFGFIRQSGSQVPSRMTTVFQGSIRWNEPLQASGNSRT